MLQWSSIKEVQQRFPVSLVTMFLCWLFCMEVGSPLVSPFLPKLSVCINSWLPGFCWSWVHVLGTHPGFLGTAGPGYTSRVPGYFLICIFLFCFSSIAKTRDYVFSRLSNLEQQMDTLSSSTHSHHQLPSLYEAWNTLIPQNIRGKHPSTSTPILVCQPSY